MNHTIDSVTTYAIVVFTSGYAWMVASSNDIMALGGLVLLGVRLYTDIRKLMRGPKDEQ